MATASFRPHLRSGALVLRRGRKEVWGLGRVMVTRARGVTRPKPKPVYRAKMVQKSGLSNWLNPWKEEKKGGEERKDQRVT